MRESAIEKECRLYVETLGGELKKWVCPGTTGVPDRILLLPFQPVAFVEFKQPDGRLSNMQQHWCARLMQMGIHIRVVDSVDEFKRFVLRLAPELVQCCDETN